METMTFKTFVGNKTFENVSYKILADECGDARELIKLPSVKQTICGKDLMVYGVICNGIEFLIGAFDPKEKLVGYIQVAEGGFVTTSELTGGFVL